MCGIAGFAGWARAPEESAVALRAMCAAIVHRGPDDEGHFVAPDVGLAMRRLSVIDVSAGHQPIGNEDGSVQIVFNGEIYNHRALRAELERRGHRFATHSDTEAIVHGYEEWGDAVVERLSGMFGFAIWDARRSRLFVARDRLGIKPMYYWAHDGGLAFASELGAFRALPSSAPALPRARRYSTCCSVTSPSPTPSTRACASSRRATRSRGRPAVRSRCGGTGRPVRAEVPMDAGEALAELRRLLDASVESHLEATYR
jgi:asparagine synthase (glutamine-hydrolysing)